jgi:hypothetical protein
MSAVATAEALPENDAPAVHAVPAAVSVYEMHAAEQKRWMIWFGFPALVASVFVALTFGTGQAWILGLAITAIVCDIFILVWLAMTSDTNGLIGEPSSGH